MTIARTTKYLMRKEKKEKGQQTNKDTGLAVEPVNLDLSVLLW